MAIQIGAKPDSGFGDPLGMLKDCHRRIERFLHILCTVAETARERTLTAEERQAIEAALLYFSTSGPLHNLDEEESLFPRLRAVDAADAAGEIGRLEADHQTAALLHGEAASLYAKWIADGHLSGDNEARLRTATTALKQLYGEHIRVEEEVVFPCAASILPPSSLSAMGPEFKARRQKL